MKRNLIAAAAAVALAVSAAASAQPGPGYGMGPGMMGGYGPGYGMGPGMMGGYGPGYGMGPGMMGGYGPGYGMGPGMMGGYGPGYGMGPGMMGGPGYGMGPGGGWGLAALNLTDTQREKIADIRREVSRKQWEIMGKMHEQQYRLQEQYESGKADDDAARKVYAAMSEAHKQMFETQLEARKRIDSVLTAEQREQLRRAPWGRWGGPGAGGAK